MFPYTEWFENWDLHWQLWQDFLAWLAKGAGIPSEGMSESPK
jgi:hypothetical protein